MYYLFRLTSDYKHAELSAPKASVFILSFSHHVDSSAKAHLQYKFHFLFNEEKNLLKKFVCS